MDDETCAFSSFENEIYTDEIDLKRLPTAGIIRLQETFLNNRFPLLTKVRDELHAAYPVRTEKLNFKQYNKR